MQQAHGSGWRAAQCEARRLLAAQLFRAGQLSQAELARALGVSEAAVRQWRARWQHGGARRLRARGGARATDVERGAVARVGPDPGSRRRGERLRHRAVDPEADRARDRGALGGALPLPLSRAAAPGARVRRSKRTGSAGSDRRARRRSATSASSPSGCCCWDETGHTFRIRLTPTWARRDASGAAHEPAARDLEHRRGHAHRPVVRAPSARRGECARGARGAPPIFAASSACPCSSSGIG